MPYAGPDFFHQLGNKDQIRCLDLLRSGYGAGAIFSPKDLSAKGLEEHTRKYKATNTELLFDPQFYTSDRPRELISEIEGTQDFVDPTVAKSLLDDALQTQKTIEVSRYIVPAPWARSLTTSWFEILRNFNFHARRWLEESNETRALIATIPVSYESIVDENDRLALLNQLCILDVQGFYIIVNVTPRTTDERLLYSLLDLAFRLKRQRYYVLLGYTQPWVMLTFPFGVDGFASGGNQNRNYFEAKNFKKADTKGFVPPRRYNQLWSPELLDWIRFPDDAEFLKDTSAWKKLHYGSPYATPLDKGNPSDIHAAELWKRTDSVKQYSWTMWEIGNQFLATQH